MTSAGNQTVISYRRDEARGASLRVYDSSRTAFGREQVFRNVAGIGPGKWSNKIGAALADCAKPIQPDHLPHRRQ